MNTQGYPLPARARFAGVVVIAAIQVSGRNTSVSDFAGKAGQA